MGKNRIPFHLVLMICLGLTGCERDNRIEPVEVGILGRVLTREEMEIARGLEPIPGYLMDAVATDLDGDGSEEYVVLMKEADLALVGQQPPASGILKIEEGVPRYIHRLPTDWLNELVAIADLDADGMLELAFVAASGGNGFGTSPTIVTWWDGERFRDQDIGELKDFWDLDGDGSFEIETSVELPQIGECGLDCDTGMAFLRVLQYAPSMVWGWEDSRIIDVSDRHPEFFLSTRVPALEDLSRELKGDLQNCVNEDCRLTVECMMHCLELVMNRAEYLGH